MYNGKEINLCGKKHGDIIEAFKGRLCRFILRSAQRVFNTGYYIVGLIGQRSIKRI